MWECKICGSESGKKHMGRCEEHYRCDDCKTKEDLIYAESGLLCHPCLDKRIQKDIESFNGDTDYTDEVVCPYCGYEHQDSYEYEDGEIDCQRCDNKFNLTKEVSVSYTTEKVINAQSEQTAQ